MQQAMTMGGLVRDLVQQPSLRRRAPWVFLATVALGAAVWWVGTSGAYTAGDDIGYNLGLAGGLLMLFLLVYSLRKRVRALTVMGPIKHWFSMHMALGIAGPVLILLHSKFELGSLNASIAFWCMVLVASSGVVGRYLYRQIHHGLYGRKTSLEQVRAKAGLGEAETKTWLRHVPEVQQALDAYSSEAQAAGRSGLRRPLRLFLLGFRGRLATRRARLILRHDLPIVAEARGWDDASLERRLRKGKRLVRAYVAHEQGIAQFAAYERLFALWHVAHLPFVFLLFFSTVAHVVYVHMY
jgi:hypothetical protein